MLAESIHETDVSKLSFYDRYITGNDLLTMAWFYLLAVLCFFIYPLASLKTGKNPRLFEALGLILLFVSLLFMILWIISCMPQNIKENNGRGRSYLLGAWTFFILNLLSVLYVGRNVYNKPTGDLICLFVTSVSFTIGAALFVRTSYPEHHISALVYKNLCSKSSVRYDSTESHMTQALDDEESTERIPLRRLVLKKKWNIYRFNTPCTFEN